MNSRLIFLILICPFFQSCNNKESSQDQVENFLNYVTTEKDNLLIELPELYNSLTNQIPDDSIERLVLVEALSKRGFKIIGWGRGNYPPSGVRIVNIVMKKENCFCQIDKIYYKTSSDSLFQMSERIRCADSLKFYNASK